jgi:glycosyltransferase involved in cell wall biosynthesis
MKPFRLAILQLDLFQMSPFARHVQNLANEIGPEFQLDLLIVNEQGMDQVPEGVNVTLLGAKASRLSKHLPAHYRAIPGLIRYLRTADVDVVLARGLSFAVPLVMASRLSRSQIPLLMSLHAALAHERENRSHRLAFAYGPLYRFVEKHVAGVIPVSQGVSDSYSRLARRPDHMTVVPNPVYSEKIDAMAEDAVEHPWFQENRPCITALTVGRLAPEKDQKLQIEAIKILRAKGVDIRLVVIGDGSLKFQLQDLACRLGVNEYVQFLGRKENPFPYMLRCDAFLLSSQYEGLPGVLIQALALGCRIISTDCVAGPREILDGERLGSLVPVGDVHKFAEAVERSLSAARPAYLKQASRAYSAKRFIKTLKDLSDH